MTERVIYIGTPPTKKQQKEWGEMFRFLLKEVESEETLDYESFEHMLHRLKDKEEQ